MGRGKDLAPYSLKELTSKVAEELVSGEFLDFGEIEQGVVDKITEHMEVTVTIGNNQEGV